VNKSLALAGDNGDLDHEMRSLRRHMQVISLMLKTYATDIESVWDKYGEDLAWILDEAEQLLAFEQRPGSSQGPATFRPALGLVSPLFLVATKSRDLCVRQRVLEVLHRSRRWEKSWNSCIASLIAQAVLRVEDGSVSQSITRKSASEEQRIRLDNVSFDRDNQRIEIRYTRAPFHRTNTATEPVIMPWRPDMENKFEYAHVSRKSLRCFGYTGIIPFTPPVEYQCHASPQ